MDEMLSISCQSDEEFQQTYLTYISDGRGRLEGVSQWPLEVGELPLVMDWGRTGVVTGVKQQVHTFTITRVRLEGTLVVYNNSIPTYGQYVSYACNYM